MKGRIAGASEHRHPGRSAGLPVMAAVADTPLRPLPANDEQTTNERRTNDEVALRGFYENCCPG
ncbi:MULTISPECIES: hypothetical protein [Paraburkholderia]|jgi:hypothetical protein|uniref:Uncharacterized protein n=1 Tax=Paraburkholderia strydomiana TaxID=1245417 RepID=A0ABW9CBP6_9BURK|nr:hypothetical protein [Paraburkholderia caledonica]